MIHDAVTRDILMDVILHVFLKLRRQITETQVAFLVIPGNDLSARPFLGIFLNPFGDLVVGRTGGDDRTKIAVINFGKIQPALIERAIGVVSAVPIQKYCAAFVHGARRQYITRQCGSRTTRKVFSVPQITRKQFDDLIFFAVLGVILGGRLGYVLFYKPGYYAAHPLEILAIWEGGMSFHGGLLGVILAAWIYARRQGIGFLRLMDFVAPLCPLGIAAGRMGNFINGELYGRVTDLPWGMVFRQGGEAPRHPSQLYQFALEGLTLFVILWWFSAKPRPTGQVSALFLIGYGVLRFIAEFGREPDAFLGLLAFGLSMGQWLCLPMIAAGAVLFAWSSRQR